MKKIKFTCPDCQSHALVEVMVNVTVSSLISEITVDAQGYLELSYSDQNNDGGKVIHYQCDNCGKIVAIGGYDELFAAIGDGTGLSECIEDGDDEYQNFYHCSDCGKRWDSIWSCACDEPCPICNKAIEPYKSVNIGLLRDE